MTKKLEDSHGPPMGMPVFALAGGEIMDVTILPDGVRISYENGEEHGRLDTTFMSLADYQALLANQPH